MILSYETIHLILSIYVFAVYVICAAIAIIYILKTIYNGYFKGFVYACILLFLFSEAYYQMNGIPFGELSVSKGAFLAMVSPLFLLMAFLFSIDNSNMNSSNREKTNT